ncbi:hypothetical protein SAY86_016180 [Trapa natans]|uniref:Uncharacterized protein n=1 Tax=Trapa natans TaxID=22666 RepID=A0AAN7LFL7_TRANT|nr:hypothetical protein SAY86_016180 [Trapa natans]
MKDDQGGSGSDVFTVQNSIPRAPNMATDDVDYANRHSSFSGASPAALYEQGRLSSEGSPMMMSPWNQTTGSPFTKSACWSSNGFEDDATASNAAGSMQNTVIGSLVREEGHIYSLAASGELLYTGSDSKNIRVWKNLKEFSAFKSSSGLVKAIIVSDGKIFTGHQDGKIRVWKVSPKAPSIHKRAGTLPTLKDIFKSSINPSNYIEVRKKRTALWIKHSDAVSCLSLSDDGSSLYSASWDRTIKVWRLSDSKCLESIKAHDDAVNSVVATADGLVFSGSADGTVKVWRRDSVARSSAKHSLAETLLRQECAVTSLAADKATSIVYCGSSDGLVNHWVRTKDNKFAHSGELKGHKLAILCLAAAGPLLLSGSADKTICVWKKEGAIHTCLSVLTGHNGPVKCLAVEVNPESAKSGGGKNGDQRWIVYSGSLDKSVKVWNVSELPPDMGNAAGTVPSHFEEHSLPGSDGRQSSAGGAARSSEI